MYSYTIFIMLLPLLSFLVLGLAGMKMQHKVAGLIGTCSLGLVTILSYTTAFQYFTADRVNGAFQTIVPYNYTWLPLGNLHFDMGILLDPISVMMLIVISTVSLMVPGARHQHLPDVYVLGACGRELLSAHRLLLSSEARHRCL